MAKTPGAAGSTTKQGETRKHEEGEDSRVNELGSRQTVEGRREQGEQQETARGQGAQQMAGQEKRGEGAAIEGGVQLGRTSAISLLEEQHEEMMKDFAAYEGSNGGKKRPIFEKIADEIAAHAEIEEKIFYPSVMSGKTEEELREAVEEHLGVKRLIADLLSMDDGDPQFDAKMTVLKEVLSHHVDDEQQKLFKILQRVEKSDLYALGDMMKVAYESLIKEHPRNRVHKETDSAAPLP